MSTEFRLVFQPTNNKSNTYTSICKDCHDPNLAGKDQYLFRPVSVLPSISKIYGKICIINCAATLVQQSIWFSTMALLDC